MIDLALSHLVDGGTHALVDRVASERIVYAYLGTMRASSRRAQFSALRTLARAIAGRPCVPTAIPWHRLTWEHVCVLRAWVSDHYKPSTGNRYLSALRGVLHAARRLDLMPDAHARRCAEVGRIAGRALPAGRALDVGEIRALFVVASFARRPDARQRYAAALALLYGAGLRREEACALVWTAVDLDAATVDVVGKGGVARRVPLPRGACDALRAWRKWRAAADNDVVLCRRDGLRMTGTNLADCVGRLGRWARLSRPVTPHDLRRSYVTHLLDAGADVLSVQRLAGHAKSDTTATYDRRGDRAAAKAVELLAVPFVER